jgi:flagellar biosynthesis protein FlhG
MGPFLLSNPAAVRSLNPRVPRDERNTMDTPPTLPRTLAVCSGKGGVGKTTVAANLACQWASLGKRVLLLDADVGLANAQITLGLHPRHTLEQVINGYVHVDDALCTGPFGLKVLAGASGTSVPGTLQDEQKARLLASLGELAPRFDLVVVDLQSGLGDSVSFFGGACDDVLLVINPEPASLADAYVTIKLLEERARSRAFHVVVNRCASEAQARQSFSRLTGVTSRFLGSRVLYSGSIPDDPTVRTATLMGQPICLRYPQAEATLAIHALAQHLLSIPPSTSGGVRLMGQLSPGALRGQREVA